MSAGSAGTTGPHNADAAEIGKFDAVAHRFWDPHGEFRPLHVINPVRTGYIAARCAVAGAAVLDVGCGGGLMCESLTRLGAHVTGIDLAPAMLQSARLHAAEQGLRIDYALQGAEDLAQSSPGRFDLVTCLEMVEHVPDPESLVRSLGQLVRPGGHVVVSTLNRNLKSFLQAIVAAEYLLRLVPRGTHEYQRLVRPAELARWGRAAGLELADVAGVVFHPFTQTATLSSDPGVNYLAHFRRDPGSGAPVGATGGG